jgi:hypothetical protein
VEVWILCSSYSSLLFVNNPIHITKGPICKPSILKSTRVIFNDNSKWTTKVGPPSATTRSVCEFCVFQYRLRTFERGEEMSFLEFCELHRPRFAVFDQFVFFADDKQRVWNYLTQDIFVWVNVRNGCECLCTGAIFVDWNRDSSSAKNAVPRSFVNRVKVKDFLRRDHVRSQV